MAATRQGRYKNSGSFVYAETEIVLGRMMKHGYFESKHFVSFVVSHTMLP